MDESHERQADDLEQDADFLEKGSDSLGDSVKDVKEEWEGKKSGTDAPGATDPEAAAPGGLGEEEEDDDHGDDPDVDEEAEDEDEETGEDDPDSSDGSG